MDEVYDWRPLGGGWQGRKKPLFSVPELSEPIYGQRSVDKDHRTRDEWGLRFLADSTSHHRCSAESETGRGKHISYEVRGRPIAGDSRLHAGGPWFAL